MFLLLITMSNKNLAEELAKLVRNNSKITVDEFFDLMEIPQDERSDFIFSAIAEQASKIIDSD